MPVQEDLEKTAKAVPDREKLLAWGHKSHLTFRRSSVSPAGRGIRLCPTRRQPRQVGGTGPRFYLDFTSLNRGEGCASFLCGSLARTTFKSLWLPDMHWSLASFRRDSDKPRNLDMVSVLIRLRPRQRDFLGPAEPTMFGPRLLLITARVCDWARLCRANRTSVP